MKKRHSRGFACISHLKPRSQIPNVENDLLFTWDVLVSGNMRNESYLYNSVINNRPATVKKICLDLAIKARFST